MNGFQTRNRYSGMRFFTPIPAEVENLLKAFPLLYSLALSLSPRRVYLKI